MTLMQTLFGATPQMQQNRLFMRLKIEETSTFILHRVNMTPVSYDTDNLLFCVMLLFEQSAEWSKAVNI